MKPLPTGGGWSAIRYSLAKARESGGLLKFYRAMRTKNACKTCAVGMGGQRGGMTNEAGRFPEVCKKSVQAMAADMQPAIDDSFWQRHTLESLRQWTPRELEAAGRLTQPLIHSEPGASYEPIDWDLALRRISGKLQGTAADETFWYFSGRSSNEAGFLLQLFARLYGTNNVNNCSYYCHQASGVGLASVTGSGTATITLDDLDHADLVFVIGGNPASNHPRLMRNLMQVRRRGGQVIVINPVVETGLVNFSVPSDVRSLLFGSEIASQYHQPHIGGDLAALTGVAKRLLESDQYDFQFLSQHCTGWDNLREQLAATSWEAITQGSGLERAEIDRIADAYASARNVVFCWTMGITHHLHGVENVQAIANLALMRGMVGRPGAGLLPIRGHSNVQGMGSVGVTPKLKQAIFDRLESEYDVVLPTQPGRDTMACIEGAAAGELKVGICLGGNLFGSNPDARFARAALARLDLVVYLSTTLNTGHVSGIGKETIILPVLARDEEPQATTQESMFNYVRLSNGGKRRHAGPRSEVDVVATLAQDVLGHRDSANESRHPFDWDAMKHTSAIRRAIARVVPGFEQMAELDQTKEEFHIGGRIFHAPEFNTPDGRARLHSHRLPATKRVDDNEFRLMTVRSEGQFNTVVYEDYDLYRGIDRRDVVLMHPSDVARLDLGDDVRVTVHGAAGSMASIRVRQFAQIRPGNVLMYYPEANCLIGRETDPRSRTPAFKGTSVTIERE